MFDSKSIGSLNVNHLIQIRSVEVAIRLQGSRLSTCKQRMTLVLIELDLAYKLIEVDMGQGEPKV